MASIRKRGKKFQALYKRNGRQRSAGTFSTEKEARAAGAAAEFGPERKGKANRRFDDYADSWLESLNLHEGTTTLYEWALEIHILPTFGQLKLVDIEAADIRSWASKLARKNLSPRSQRIVFGVMQRIMELAVEDDIIEVSPVRKSAKAALTPSKKRKKNDFLTPAQLIELSNLVAPRYKVAVLTMGMCGLRFGEMAGLKYENVHLDELHPRISVVGAMKEYNGTIYWEPKTKTDEQHDVLIPKPLLGPLKAHLNKYADHAEFVFSGQNGKPLRRHWNRRHFKPAAAKMGLPSRMSPHDLRHSCVSFLLDAGVPLHDIAAWVGHDGIRTTVGYGGGYEKQKETAKVLEAVFGG